MFETHSWGLSIETLLMMLVAVFLVLILVIFNLTLPIMAGVYIVGDLGGSFYLAPYSVSFFCIGNMLTIPLGKPAATRLSPIQLYLVCLGSFCLCSWFCAIASHYLTFIIFRLLSGIALGPLYILISNVFIPYLLAQKEASCIEQSKSIASEKDVALISKFKFFHFRKKFDDHEFMIALALVLSVSMPTLAACWGDLVAYFAFWQILFYINLPITIILMIYTGYGLRDLNQSPTETFFDPFGYIFYSIAIIFLGTALTTGQEFDWFRSYWTGGLIIFGSICLIGFIIRSLYAKYPIFDIRLFKNHAFCFAAINLCLIYSIYFGTIILLAHWLHLFVNYTPYWLALLTMILTFGSWLPLFLEYEHYNPRLPLGIALVSLMISCFYSTNFNEYINFGRIAFSRILAGVTLVFFLPPLFNLVMTSFPQEKRIECANAFNLIRLLGAAMGAALYIIIWQRRVVFYHDRLGSRLTEFSQITTLFLERAKQFHLSHHQAMAQLNVYLERQATALALEDCFYLMGWMVVFLLILWSTTFITPTRIHTLSKKIHARLTMLQS